MPLPIRGLTQAALNANQGRINPIKDREQCDLTLGNISCDGSTRCYLCNLSIIPHTKIFRTFCIDENNTKIDTSTQWIKERCSTDNDYPECEHIIPCISLGGIYGNPWDLDIMLHKAVKSRLTQPQSSIITINTTNFLDSQMRINYAWAHKICNNIKSNNPLIHNVGGLWTIADQKLDTLLDKIFINQDWRKFYDRYFLLHNKTINISLPNNLVHSNTQNNSHMNPDKTIMKSAAINRLQLVCDLLNLPQFKPLIPISTMIQAPTFTGNPSVVSSSVQRRRNVQSVSVQRRQNISRITQNQQRLLNIQNIAATRRQADMARDRRALRQEIDFPTSPNHISPMLSAPARQVSPVSPLLGRRPRSRGGGIDKYIIKYIEDIKKTENFELFKNFILYLDKKKISLVYEYNKIRTTKSSSNLMKIPNLMKSSNQTESSNKTKYMKILVFNNDYLYKYYNKILSIFIKKINPNIIRQELEIYDKYLKDFKKFLKSEYNIHKELDNIHEIFSNVLLSYFQLSIARGIINYYIKRK